MENKFKLLPYFILITIILGCKKESYNISTFDAYKEEPPKNPFLADSPWPITHYNCYAQASSPYAGPISLQNIKRDFLKGSPGMISILISGIYPSGKRAVWAGNSSHIVKAFDTPLGFEIIDSKLKENTTVGTIFSVEDATSGAYTFIDKDFTFFTPRNTTIYAYSDSIQYDENSAISLLRTFNIPNSIVENGEKIVGMTLTYDGNIVFATSKGLIGLLDRNFLNFKYLRFEDEEISNSIACDEENGIYIVTSKNMHRVQWTGTQLSTNTTDGAWTSKYETGNNAGGIRLGEGSGSTPTLMGFGSNDKFVVITDGQELMHVVLFWRGSIPEDWKQLPGTLDRRIAAQLPIKFGNESTKKSLSEQSVCVRGYGILVVNNELKNSTSNRTANILLSGVPQNAPYGVEKFIWNTKSRTLSTSWVNKNVSFPSGIPCMSAATNMAYCIGQKNGYWNFTALDWSSGRTVFEYPLGNNIQYNSAYAATEIGLNNSLYSGTLLGAVGIWQP